MVAGYGVQQRIGPIEYVYEDAFLLLVYLCGVRDWLAADVVGRVRKVSEASDVE